MTGPPGGAQSAVFDGVRKRIQKRSIITIDKVGTIVGCNQTARDLFGYELGTLIDRNVRDLMPEPFKSQHSHYVERYLTTQKSHGAIGTWKERPAVHRDGQTFHIRIALSPTMHDGEPHFSALIEPLYECTLSCNDKDLIVATSGSPWLIFGMRNEELVGEKIEKLLKNASDWRGKVDKGQRVVICHYVDGDEFAVALTIKKQGTLLVGHFTEAPPLRMKICMLKTGVISECSGDSKALLGYKPKNLVGMRLNDLLDAAEIANIVLDAKVVISLRHRDGRTVYASLRVTKSRLPDGTAMYQGVVKGHRAEESGLLKCKRLRYGGPVFGWYELGPSLGHGMCGPVKRAVHRLTGEEVAIKTLSRERYRELKMVFPPAEIRLMERVRHPNLMRMLEVIWTEDDIYLVLELIDGGEFFEYCSAAGQLTEQQARTFWRQLLGGVDYLHRSFICHRDIKLENIVLDSNHNIKLVDFGFACSFYTGEKMEVFCGSPDYAAPELVGNQLYEGPQVDIWACAVVLYVMVTGFIPFPNPTRCLACEWLWPPGLQPSSQLNDIVKSVFQPAKQRATMEALLAHSWTNVGEAGPPVRVEVVPVRHKEELDEDILEEMEDHFGWHRDAVESALSAHHTPSQIATTYHLLEYKKHKASLPKNPIWQAGGGAGKKKSACVVN